MKINDLCEAVQKETGIRSYEDAQFYIITYNYKNNNAVRAALYAKNKDKVSGFLGEVSAERSFIPSHENDLVIRNAILNDTVKGKGYGKKLYQALLAGAPKEYTRLASRLSNRENNVEVPSIWKSLGGYEKDGWAYIDRNSKINEWGKIEVGSNTPPGITKNHTKLMAKRLGFNVNQDGQPPQLLASGKINTKVPKTKKSLPNQLPKAQMTYWTDGNTTDIAESTAVLDKPTKVSDIRFKEDFKIVRGDDWYKEMGQFEAYANNKLIGVIRYTMLNDHITIHGIHIDKNYEQIGFGDLLLNKFNKKYEGFKIETKISDSISESLINVQLDPRTWVDYHVKVYKNPSVSDVLRLLDKSRHQRLRGVIMDKNIYFWDAYDAIHASVINAIGREGISSINEFDIVKDYNRTTDRLGTQPWLSWHNEVDDPYLPSRQPLVRYLKDGRIKINRHVDTHLHKDNVFESSDLTSQKDTENFVNEFIEEIVNIEHRAFEKYKNNELKFIYYWYMDDVFIITALTDFITVKEEDFSDADIEKAYRFAVKHYDLIISTLHKQQERLNTVARIIKRSNLPNQRKVLQKFDNLKASISTNLKFYKEDFKRLYMQ